ncbi:hypothetical protein K8B33_08245 [Alcanivorax sp. JB21]|uniref:hypothetical protein n=1 Tax=Alcanivorax limicola TaxID=2874102 RepID=UPI001CBAAC3F|nr:hypothetical protein [Alcanivorax limicola]MBZ2189084.1 hypothetical protein [Alcanivorax limicola]
MKSIVMKTHVVKKALCAALVMFAAPALAETTTPAGFSDQIIRSEPRTETSRLLDRQRAAEAPQESEVPASVYVDSQRRLTETFRRPVPETLREETTRR